MLGYGGHFLTKSRRYSVTFGQLRKARTDHRHAERHPGGERDPWGRPLDQTIVLILNTWTYAGTGYTAATAGGWRSPRLPAPASTDAQPARNAPLLRDNDRRTCDEPAQYQVPETAGLPGQNGRRACS